MFSTWFNEVISLGGDVESVECVLRHGNPEDVEMDPSRLKEASAFIKKAISEKAFPGAVFLVARNGTVVAHEACGEAVSIPSELSKPMKLDTIFDTGSVTKPVATATSLMILLEKGKVLLDDPVNLYIPEYTGEEKEKTTLHNLLTHTAGIPDPIQLYKRCKTREDFLREICHVELECPPGSKVSYSCLGFILLAFIIEKVAGESLASFSRREIFSLLGMKDTLFNPPAKLKDRIAATERCSWRGRILVGEVHDENAFGMGGVSGNAGLFSTAQDLAIFGQTFLNMGAYAHNRILSSATVELMTKNHTVGLEEPRGLGWGVKAEKGSQAGELLSPLTFGHTGFPGVSLWADPVNKLITVLMTNRVHPTRENEAILRVRPLFHNIIASSIIG